MAVLDTWTSRAARWKPDRPSAASRSLPSSQAGSTVSVAEWRTRATRRNPVSAACIASGSILSRIGPRGA